MKVERFLFIFVLPLIVFFICSSDVQAEETYTYSATIGHSRYGVCDWTFTATTEFVLYLDTSSPYARVMRSLYMHNGYLQHWTLGNGADPAQYVVSYSRNCSEQFLSWVAYNDWRGVIGYYEYYEYGSITSFTTNMKVFDTYEHAVAYLQSGATDGWINEPPVDLDNLGSLSDSLPVPHVTFLDGGTDGKLFYFDNSSEDYCIEVKGRWYSVDDIELYKEKAMWKYKYSSLIKNDLSIWVPANDKVSSTLTFSYYDIGAESFYDLLELFPVENRTYLGGTNSVSNYLFGYNDALNTLKTLLSSSGGGFNSPELYIRYWIKDTSGNYIYGKWAHLYTDLVDPDGSSGSRWDSFNQLDGFNQSVNGLSDDELSDLELSGYSRLDRDVEHGSVFDSSSFDDLSGSLESFGDMLQSASRSVNDVPRLVSSVFGFLPQWLVEFIGIAIAAVILLRILGR